MTTETLTPARIVCTGATILQGNKAGIGFQFVNEDGTLGREAYFDRKSKAVGGGTPGCIYEIDTSNEGKTVHAPLRFKGMWPNDAQRLAWKAEHDLILTRERAEKTRKASEKETVDGALATLDPIRHLYHKTDGIGRRLLLAQVIEYMQRNPMYDGSR